jgi:serine/threonine protein kinase
MLVMKDAHTMQLDLGSALYLPQSQDPDFSLPASMFRGTPQYAPPEIFHKQPFHPESADCWALGAMLYTMLFAKMPTLSGLQRHGQGWSCIRADSISFLMESLLVSLLNEDRLRRMSLEECLKCLESCECSRVDTE